MLAVLDACVVVSGGVAVWLTLDEVLGALTVVPNLLLLLPITSVFDDLTNFFGLFSS